MRIPLLDLKAQYQTIKKDIDDVLIKIAESQHFILGPEVEKLEKNICEYLNCKHAVGVSSGTDALLIALMAIGIKPGDEVILPTYSFFATAGVVARMNAFPVFTDIESVTFNIKPEDIEKKITSKTKAIIPVHLYGQSAEMREINEIARKYDLKVIEDGAQAIGAQYRDGRNVGNLGDIGCFSFFPSKNLGCFGDGGMVTTNNDILYEKIKILRVHGGKPKYYHKVIGGNFRLDAIQAAVLNVKLPHLNEWSEKRRQNADLYNKLFIEANLAKETRVTEFNAENKLLLPKAVYRNEKSLINHHIYNQYVIRVEQRDELRKHLTKNEIGTEIYYPVPFHRQECFAYLNCRDEDYTNSNFAAEKSIALPVYPELTEQQIEFVVSKIKEFVINS